MQTNYRENVSKIVGWGHWFTFCNVLIGVFVGFRYAWAGGWPTGIIDNAFLATYTVGHFAFLFFAGFIVLLFPLAFILPWWRLYRTVAIIVATAAQSLLLLDSQFYTSLGMHSNALLFELLFHADSEQQISMAWWKLGGTVLLLLALEIALANWLSLWRESRSRRVFGKRVTQVFFACFFAYNFAYAIADVNGHRGITRQQEFYPISFPLTAKTTLSKWGVTSSTETSEDGLNVRFHYPLAPIAASPNTNTNVVVVVVSSLRADMLNPTNMPYTTKLARQSLWSSRYYSSGKEHDSAMFGLLYGIPATYSRAAEYSLTPPAMTHWLKQNGYDLSLFSTRPTEQPTLYSDFETQYSPEQRVNAAIADTATLHHWQKYYEQTQDQAGFYLINLTGVQRYATPPGFSNPFQPDLEGVLLLDNNVQMDDDGLVNRYKNAVLHVDQLINLVSEHINFDNTILVITSDHGVNFNNTESAKHQHDFSPANVQIPFLMMGAGISPQVVDGLTTHYDFSATLVQMLTDKYVSTRNFSSGINLADVQRTAHHWLLLGQRNDFALIEPDRLTQVMKFGDYQIYDNLMEAQDKAKLRVAPMLEAVREMQRFSRD
ncbi:DUF3413 domain-containing protein [Echinimonas agarilytica]|uniref:DUF3413 domain-containing protein n=1 Tax=Echinimonas agarilytica TaxID=1215918 RepID=A0AA41W744_9GAMM|nr:DUF3413 domain-containing protein [Echinimonas agarilytica]MCM2679836.1 DUF3413 domain-containing protein [Echinimonas agarilytica]